MKFFLLSEAKEYNHRPQIRLPYDLKDEIYIRKGNYNNIGKISIWKVHESEMNFYADILMEPVLLLKEKVKEVIQLYNQQIQYKQVILLGDKKDTVELYYLPLLENVKGISESGNRFRIINIPSLLWKPMFILCTEQNRYVVVNIEVIEAFLKRRITGIGIQAISIINEEISVYGDKY